MSLKSELNEKKLFIDNEIDRYLPAETEYPDIIFKAM